MLCICETHSAMSNEYLYRCCYDTFSLCKTCFHFPSLSGATLVVIGTHAAFRELEQSDVDELLMEPV